MTNAIQNPPVSYDIDEIIKAAGFKMVTEVRHPDSGHSPFGTWHRRYENGKYNLRTSCHTMGGWGAVLFVEETRIASAGDRRQLVKLFADIGVDVRTQAQRVLPVMLSKLMEIGGIKFKITGPNSAIIECEGQRFRISPYEKR